MVKLIERDIGGVDYERDQRIRVELIEGTKGMKLRSNDRGLRVKLV